MYLVFWMCALDGWMLEPTLRCKIRSFALLV